MVRIWAGLVLLIKSINAATVVDLPDPVGPVTNTNPCLKLAMVSKVECKLGEVFSLLSKVASPEFVPPNSSCCKLGIEQGMALNTAAVPRLWV